ncbi:hypothetical protein DN407_31285 (plasmid) [Bacillus sp. JAS24-2]|nr:hypothetical protein DN407_31285 [Bacillus sp. JAS24-2]
MIKINPIGVTKKREECRLLYYKKIKEYILNSRKLILENSFFIFTQKTLLNNSYILKFNKVVIILVIVQIWRVLKKRKIVVWVF